MNNPPFHASLKPIKVIIGLNMAECLVCLITSCEIANILTTSAYIGGIWFEVNSTPWIYLIYKRALATHPKLKRLLQLSVPTTLSALENRPFL